MKKSTYESGKNFPTLLDRRFLACPECGWVHYVMTAEERVANQRTLEHLGERYQLNEAERNLYEAAFRQCLRCEAPANTFRAARALDLDRAEGHVVTPVLVELDVGTH